ncbi:MAG: carboxylate-amine ligase [Rhodospirillaceae bacterium]|jgi:glutamate---cysteine ligase / carboxylate-amine ligase|nr:carboxylate-amine ligase [Rhodospirillaceae bacterium]MBT4491119.1 carboxylate-amine ligase [Rhodospirillaceae bacterium]MBT5192691.1 carboxylate-amine ligase [Rhodospirillaceae bacterium]MBT5894334.1 carboxylate-amine ligase [Rhodospirillaceae bacterium]
MTTSQPSFTMGIEEEYLLVDRESRDLANNPPAELLADCEARLGHQVTAEFMRSQIEVGTRVCRNIGEARGELQELRGTVAEVAAQYGLAPIAASTHPFAHWSHQSHTDKERYDDLAHALQATARRLLISGMHVHVAVEPEDMRIDLMNQATYFLPHLLALSTSSPFWSGENTGLMSYRLTVFDALPRTGVPERFDSFGEYERLVARLVSAGVIEDGTKIWWDMRPSARYPTLEMRMTDICTALEDTLTVASLYQCILAMLHRLRNANQRWRIYPLICVEENRWRAQRYGITDTMVDFGLGKQVPYGELLAEIMDMVAPDAEALGCAEEVRHARQILARGTSAQSQVRIYEEALAEGMERQAALNKVVDWLIEETVRDL